VVPDPFNAGLTTRKAIYQPVPHDRSTGYIIDVQACTHCGACAPVCPTQAIQLAQDGRRKFHILRRR
jgi:heterodisulfide reductase subunit A